MGTALPGTGTGATDAGPGPAVGVGTEDPSLVTEASGAGRAGRGAAGTRWPAPTGCRPRTPCMASIGRAGSPSEARRRLTCWSLALTRRAVSLTPTPERSRRVASFCWSGDRPKGMAGSRSRAARRLQRLVVRAPQCGRGDMVRKPHPERVTTTGSGTETWHHKRRWAAVWQAVCRFCPVCAAPRRPQPKKESGQWHE